MILPADCTQPWGVGPDWVPRGRSLPISAKFHFRKFAPCCRCECGWDHDVDLDLTGHQHDGCMPSLPRYATCPSASAVRRRAVAGPPRRGVRASSNIKGVYLPPLGSPQLSSAAASAASVSSLRSSAFSLQPSFLFQSPDFPVSSSKTQPKCSSPLSSSLSWPPWPLPAQPTPSISAVVVVVVALAARLSLSPRPGLEARPLLSPPPRLPAVSAPPRAALAVAVAVAATFLALRLSTATPSAALLTCLVSPTLTARLVRLFNPPSFQP